MQVALLDLSFAGLLKNSLMLFLGYLPRSGLGLLWQLLYWGAVALFWPISSFVLILTSLWLPCLLSLMAIYPALEKSFDIEKKSRPSVRPSSTVTTTSNFTARDALRSSFLLRKRRKKGIMS